MEQPEISREMIWDTCMWVSWRKRKHSYRLPVRKLGEDEEEEKEEEEEGEEEEEEEEQRSEKLE